MGSVSNARYDTQLLVKQNPPGFVEAIRAKYGHGTYYAYGRHLTTRPWDNLSLFHSFRVSHPQDGLEHVRTKLSDKARNLRPFQLTLKGFQTYSYVPPRIALARDDDRIGLKIRSGQLTKLHIELSEEFHHALSNRRKGYMRSPEVEDPVTSQTYREHPFNNLKKSFRVPLQRNLSGEDQMATLQRLEADFEGQAVGFATAIGLRTVSRVQESLEDPPIWVQLGEDIMFPEEEGSF